MICVSIAATASACFVSHTKSRWPFGLEVWGNRIVLHINDIV
jgi:hypothetical protein